MKKGFLFAIAIALTLASCGNKSQSNTSSTDSTSEVTSAQASSESTGDADGNATQALSSEAKATVDNLTAELQKAVNAKDSKAAITTLANLQAIYKNLVEQGKLDEAKAYGSAIKQFVNDNADAIKKVASDNTTVADLVSGISNLPTSASTTVEAAKAAITQDVVNLASPTIAKGQTIVSTAEAAAAAVKNVPASTKKAAEDAANKAVNDAKSAAEQKANDAVNNAKAKAASKVNEANQKANDAVNKAANKALKGLGL